MNDRVSRHFCSVLLLYPSVYTGAGAKVLALHLDHSRLFSIFTGQDVSWSWGEAIDQPDILSKRPVIQDNLLLM